MLFRSRRSAVDITHVVRTGTPDGRVQVFINDADIVPHEVPNQLTAMAGFREGQMTKGAWGGPVLLERYRNGSQFAQEYIRERICPQAEFTGGGELPNETGQMNAQVVPYGRSMGSNAGSSVGEVYFRCGSDFGYVTATTVYTAPPSGQGVTTGSQPWRAAAYSSRRTLAAAPRVHCAPPIPDRNGSSKSRCAARTSRTSRPLISSPRNR